MRSVFRAWILGWMACLGAVCPTTAAIAQGEDSPAVSGESLERSQPPVVFSARMTLGKTSLHPGPAARPEREAPVPDNLLPAYAHLAVEVHFTNPDPNHPLEIDPLMEKEVWLLDAQPDSASGDSASQNRMFRLVSLNRNEPLTLEPGGSKTVMALFELAFIPGNGFLSSPRKREYFIGLQLGSQLAIRRFVFDPGVAVEGLMKAK